MFGFRVVNVPSFLKACSSENISADSNWGYHLDNNPWTLPANQAVAFHPNLDYVLVKADLGIDVKVFCLLKDLLPSYGAL